MTAARSPAGTTRRTAPPTAAVFLIAAAGALAGVAAATNVPGHLAGAHPHHWSYVHGAMPKGNDLQKSNHTLLDARAVHVRANWEVILFLNV